LIEYKMLVTPSIITGGVAALAIPFGNPGGQTPLSSSSVNKGMGFNITEQDESICDAGSRQWTGWVHVSNEKSLFFCKAEFRNLLLLGAANISRVLRESLQPDHGSRGLMDEWVR
jgi:hypothetical protein